MEYILGFGSAHNALRAESILKEKTEIRFRLLPAPKMLDKQCGLVISLEGDDIEAAVRVLDKEGMEPRSVYRKEGDEYVKM